VCARACVMISCVQNISKSYERTLTQFCGEVRRDSVNNLGLLFDVGSDTEQYPYQGFLNPEIFHCPARPTSLLSRSFLV